jgi:hypothetical protein
MRYPLSLLLLVTMLGGCANIKFGRDKEETPAPPAHWKSSDAGSRDRKGGVFDALIHGFGTRPDPGVDPAAFYRQNYQLWRRDHLALTRAVGRNRLGSIDSMRRCVGSLGGMKEMLEREEQREELTAMQERYQSIAEKSLGGMQPTAFSLALDRLRWRIEKHYKPGSKGLVFRTAEYFRQLEEEEFEEPEMFD